MGIRSEAAQTGVDARRSTESPAVDGERSSMCHDTGAKSQLPYNAVYYGFFCVVIILCSLQLLVGYADSGDFSRSVGFVLEKPYGFSAMWPAADSAEFGRRFYHEWHDRWIYLASGPTKHLSTLSTYKIYFFLQTYFCKITLLDSQYYSVIAGSLLTRLIYFALYGMLFYEIRNRYTCAVSSIFIAMSCAIILDVNISAMFNTFYEDQVAIIFMPLLIWLFVKYYRKPSLLIALIIVGSATFIGSAKTSYFYLPLLIAPFVLTLIKRRKEIVCLCLTILLAQFMAVLPIIYGKYGRVNSYNALYLGALKMVTPDETDTITRIGDKPVYYECIGEEPFNNPKGKACMEKANATYGDVAKLVVSNPSIAFRMIARVFADGNSVEITYLGKSISGSTDFSRIPVYNLVAISFKNIYPIIMAIIAVLSLTAVGLIVRRQLGRDDFMILIALFLTSFGLTQYIVALGDGFRDLAKHLLAGNYSLALSSVLFVSGFAAYWQKCRAKTGLGE